MTHRTRETGPESLLGAGGGGLPLAPEVPPHNRYDALGMEEGYYGKDLRKGNHKKLAHLLPASEPVPQKKRQKEC